MKSQSSPASFILGGGNINSLSTSPSLSATTAVSLPSNNHRAGTYSLVRDNSNNTGEHERRPLDDLRDDDQHLLASKYSSVPFKYVILISVVLLIIGGLSSFSFVYEQWPWISKPQQAGAIINFTVVIFLELAFGIPLLFQHYCAWINHLPIYKWRIAAFPLIIAFFYTLSSFLLGSFDPTSVVILLLMGLFPTRTLQIHQDDRDWTWVDSSVCLLLWLPLNNFWNVYSINLNTPETLITNIESLSYKWWSITTSILIMLSFGTVRPIILLGYSLIPTKRDFLILLACVTMLAAILLPISFLTDWFVVPKDFAFLDGLFIWLRMFLAVAIPEEMLFRGLVLNALIRVTGREYVSIGVSSLLYGCAHWTKGVTYLFSFYSAFYVFLSGLIFGIAFIKSGSRQFAGIVSHSFLAFFMYTFISIPHYSQILEPIK